MDTMPEEEGGGGRWERARRARGSRRWLGPFLVIVVVPILIGAAVVLDRGPRRRVRRDSPRHRAQISERAVGQHGGPGAMA